MKINVVLNYLYDMVVLITMLYSFYLLFWKKYGKKQRHFYLYIVFIFIVDVLRNYIDYLRYEINQFYFYFPLFFVTVCYFVYFFIQEYKDVLNRILLIFASLLSIFFVAFFQYKVNDLTISTSTLLVLIVYQLFIVLQWFWYIINHTDEQKITDKQAFWVSCALLIWSTFALFRMYPMYDLNKIDNNFLSSIISFFSVINIVTYLLYLRGLKCVNHNVLRSFNHF